ncbi:MAG TPA: response regulator [Chitinophagaceae bacterium]|jgi:CheY-like chemotaxis protein|nr:response regulator [Chitinophagaceae bacterium]
METGNNILPTVLVVDDDEDLLHIIGFKLRAEGFHTLISQNGENVRDIITQNKPDLILLDLHMQGIDGGDICREIKSDPLTCSIPVLLFSANDNIKTIQKECGADGFISKPLENNVLVSAIQHYLPRQTQV